jgi:hypothetical protein
MADQEESPVSAFTAFPTITLRARGKATQTKGFKANS